MSDVRTGTPDVADTMVGLFTALGSDKAFINPGTDTFPLQEAWASRMERGLECPDPVMCTHEFTAVSAAHGYYLVTGRPQTALVHVDAGTLNAGGAVSNAHGDQAGVVLCAGRAPYTSADRAHGGKDVYIQWGQERLDQATILQEYVKWHHELTLVDDVGPTMMRAFQMAGCPPAGPVYLTFAREFLLQEAAGVNMPGPRDLVRAHPPAADPDAIVEAARMLLAADRPLLVVGRNGREPSSVAEIAALADLLGVSIADTYECASAPGDHPLYIGPRLGEQLPLADTVLFVETKVPYVPSLMRPAADAKVIFLDRDPPHHNLVTWDFPADLRITAASTLGLKALREAVEDLMSPKVRAAARARGARIAAEHKTWKQAAEKRARSRGAAGPIHPEWLMWNLKQVLPRDAVILEDVVTNRKWAQIHLTPGEPGSLFTPGGSCLGWAVNAAIGCKLGRPDRMVVSLMGDGGFTFANPVAALWTAVNADAPGLTVIFNNACYAAAQDFIPDLYPGGAVERLGHGVVTRMTPSPDFAEIAKACGASGITLTDPVAVPTTLARAVDEVQNGCSVVIDARLAPS